MDQIKIGKFIAELRKAENLTQEALGQKIGVTNKTVSRWENGNYMPDIETLKLLSETFHVSINELLCGARLDDTQFRAAADLNIVSVLCESAFSFKEQSAFWRQKWLREHKAAIACCVVLAALLFAAACYFSLPPLSAAAALLSLLAYALLRNRMMIYIEDHLYPQSK
ncbi:MAG: helix-turn-helix transcriptional regulator [Oscillospiraceae bacterium]